jgi:hypothetical protein
MGWFDWTNVEIASGHSPPPLAFTLLPSALLRYQQHSLGPSGIILLYSTIDKRLSLANLPDTVLYRISPRIASPHTLN